MRVLRAWTLALVGALLLAIPADAATDMLTAVGTATAPTTSTCPAGPQPAGVCTGGWFYIGGAANVVVHVWESAGTATVLLEHRIDSTGAISTLKTWTNPAATQIPVALSPASGYVRVRVTAIGGGGTVKAKLEATYTTNVPGGRLF